MGRGWSQLDLAIRARIDPTTISRVERGLQVVYPAWRRRLAAAFALPEEELFQAVEEPAARDFPADPPPLRSLVAVEAEINAATRVNP